ncbi:MAG: heavy metal translocating P-type ATPase [Candidatus Cloacimonetes bacterium]|jgi:Cu+-exporting ATPase|nr:heavy metal translocating P-type ATPase [Candidatus Cloacimonadota bacterium]MDD2210940.1 heavy metal translocating P-type ATPase [Candidatus Cloacimonadota bacterium]MDD3281867.1 heavy metal translocating P-type ATPase [Candidatus Cloacimonadota bacterium]MDD4231502.1 heavy metal translocating P-type ATPase [Candidatus Cloacimonadota bacterium]MDY0299430.1 heavy metal translocating P-type ATPase [Candidatus Cloacimonadaceae bacterium]
MQLQIGIDGMHCASCSANVEKSLNALKGVSTAHVNLALEEAMVEFDEHKVDKARILKSITDLGFKIRDSLHIDEDEQISKMHIARKRMTISWIITAIVVLLMIPHMFFGGEIIDHIADAWIMFALSLSAMLFPARHVYVSAFKSVKSRAANMDVLIALGTISSLMVSPLSLVVKGISAHDFAGIAAMILSFHLTGRYLESRARGKASEAIRKLISLGAKTAILMVDGQEKEVPIHRIKEGDIFVVKPGSKVPTDGIITEGSSALDESLATGESMPVMRSQGDMVLGATINLEGYFKAKASKIGSETFLAQVIRMVSEAQHSKVPIQLLADKITAIFVPVILLLAVSVFVAWLVFPGFMATIAATILSVLPLSLPSQGLAAALMATIATLVIACPCALGLATPTALMVGSGIGANNGILIRSGEALQRMKDVNTVLLDKTGTLTQGKPELIKMQSVMGSDSDNMSLVYSLENSSEHPLAEAFKTAAKAGKHQLLPVKNFAASVGKGISGYIGAKKYYAGSERWLKSLGIESQIHPEPDLSYAGKIYLADESSVLALFYVADTIRDEAQEMVKSLRAKGINPIMMSGDNDKTAKAIAQKCGITEVMANVLPADKAGKVKQLQAEGRVVAMIGDGINDAPALKQADIGIAMGMGTDIAIEAADITILRGDLRLIPLTLKLSISTFSKIRQNLFWAFFYNLIAIPLAAFGVLHPVIAEIAMALSSITVVSNANLLKRKFVAR